MALGKKLIISMLVFGVFGVWYAVFAGEYVPGVYIFDVGQGDAIFIQAPNGNQVLIDGGPDDTVLSRLGTVMPFYDHSIDVLLLTHPHADHLRGLMEVIKRYDIGMVIESGVVYDTADYKEWNDVLEKHSIPIVYAVHGKDIRVDTDVTLSLLAPLENHKSVSVKNIHDSMVVSRLVFGGSSMLLTGDMEDDLERKLLFVGVPLLADILKVGHHGSKTSSSEVLLDAVHPKVAVISSGKRNKYGHPYTEVLSRMVDHAVQIFRTDELGTIALPFRSGSLAWDALYAQ